MVLFQAIDQRLKWQAGREDDVQFLRLALRVVGARGALTLALHLTRRLVELGGQPECSNASDVDFPLFE